MRAVPLNRYIIFFAIAATGCLADLGTKSWIFAKLGPPPSRTLWLWENVFGLQTSLNEGALFGMGQGKVWFFAVLSLVALAAIVVWLFAFSAARDRFLTVALACVSGGILGNLYDRLGLHGLKWMFATPGHGIGEPVYAVRDWILVRFGGWGDWPNFNIADSLLVCGAILLVWHAYRAETEQNGQGSMINDQ
ncbi:MAG: signal peptidase II [Planctomycetota bacterium]|nr:signal peptidase II [Planctomycetota bacterium]